MKKLCLFAFATLTSVCLFTSCDKEDVSDLLNDISSAKVTIAPSGADTISHEFKGVLATTDSSSIYVVATADGDSNIAYPSLSVNMRIKEAGANTYNVSVPINSISSLLSSSLNLTELKNSLGNSVILAISSKKYWIMTSGKIELTTNESGSKKGTFSGDCVFVDSDDLISLTTATSPISGKFSAVSVSI